MWRRGRRLKAFAGPRGGVNEVAFHPDGKRLAVAGSEVVEVWDLENVRRLHELKGHKKWVYCLAYSPDGKWLATGGWDRTVKLRDAATGAEALTIFAHEGFVLSLAFSPDSRNLATTSEDRSVRLWEVPSGRRLATFHGHTDFVQAVAFRPDGREVAHGEPRRVDPVLGPPDEPSRRGRTRPAGWIVSPSGATDFGSSRSRELTRNRCGHEGLESPHRRARHRAGRDRLRESTRRVRAPAQTHPSRTSQRRAPTASWSRRSSMPRGIGRRASRSKEYSLSSVDRPRRGRAAGSSTP